MPYIELPRAVYERQLAIRTQDRLRRARYLGKHPREDRTNEYASNNARREKIATDDRLSRLFIFWDGESPQDSGYSFFANSVGYELLHPYLSTEECFQLIMDTALEYPKAIHVSFGFNLDVSFMVKDMPRMQLSALHHYNATIWKDWQIEHIPHKWFSLRNGDVHVKIYDYHTFFPGSYTKALIDFGVGTREERARIAQEKARRSEFLWRDIAEIADYCRLELKLGPLLGNALRDALYAGSNYVPKSWHGPGAIARMALERHKVYDAMAKCPAPVRVATQYAFAGGRFEQLIAGHAERTVYEADINSAYPYYAATLLPNLAKGKWRKGRNYEPGKFGVYHIRYNAEPDRYRLYPLFRRDADKTVCWPNEVDGWYWAPEAELVADDKDAKFKEAWIFDEDDDSDRPFAFLADYYLHRKAADRAGSIAAYTFKILINAIFGQLAQRAGWNREKNMPPKSHQLEWAGTITSACRAAVYRAAIQCGEDLVSIHTDSVQSFRPLDFLATGSALGEWKLTKFSEGIFWQSGVYYLREDLGYPEGLGYGWCKAKTRGIPKGAYTPEDLLHSLKAKESLRISKKVFVTYGLADAGQYDKMNTWQLEPHELEFGGTGKRMHQETGIGGISHCAEVCSLIPGGDLHRLVQYDFEGLLNGVKSHKHHLPWLDGEDKAISEFDDMIMFDADHLDPEEEWIREYA